MSKESFEQFVERQEKKLDKAKKMVEEVKERWKDKIEEFEIEESVEKSVKELKKLWEENEKEAGRKKTFDEAFPFFLSLPFPEASLFLLEKTSNKFLKEFDWKKFKKKVYFEIKLGLFLSAFLHKNTENYISSQKEKGIKEEKIKPIEVHLNVEELPVCLDYLGYQNPQKLHLSVKGNLGNWTGRKMEGGRIIVKGNCGHYTGQDMRGGEIIVKENCGEYTGAWMEDGVLILEGEVKSFDESAFSSNNRGTIIWRKKIWENGNWTKEGKEMLLKIPIK